MFMTENPGVRCWEGAHRIWAFFFAVPCLLIFGIILPAILFGVLMKNSKKLQERNFISKYLFIYASYKPTHYYWEFIILFRKSLIFLLFTIFYAKSLQGTLIFTVILGFAAFHVKRPPYNERSLNRAEGLALVALLSMIYFQLLLDFKTKPYWAQILSYVVVGAINAAFVFVCAKLLYECNKKRIKDFAEGVKRSLSMSKNDERNGSSTSTRTNISFLGLCKLFSFRRTSSQDREMEAPISTQEIIAQVKKEVVKHDDEENPYRTTTAGNLLRSVETQQECNEIGNIDPHFVDNADPMPSSARHLRNYSMSDTSRLYGENEDGIRYTIHTPRHTRQISWKVPDDPNQGLISLNSSRSGSSQAIEMPRGLSSGSDRANLREDGISDPFELGGKGLRIHKRTSSKEVLSAGLPKEKSNFYSTFHQRTFSSEELIRPDMKSEEYLSLPSLLRSPTEEEGFQQDQIKLENLIAGLQTPRQYASEQKLGLPPINEIDERFYEKSLPTESEQDNHHGLGGEFRTPSANQLDARDKLGLPIESNQIVINFGDRTIAEANEEEEATFVQELKQDIADDLQYEEDEEDESLGENDVAVENHDYRHYNHNDNANVDDDDDAEENKEDF